MPVDSRPSCTQAPEVIRGVGETEMCVVVRRDGKGRKGGGREAWGEKMRKGMCAWCYK